MEGLLVDGDVVNAMDANALPVGECGDLAGCEIEFGNGLGFSDFFEEGFS